MRFLFFLRRLGNERIFGVIGFSQGKCFRERCTDSERIKDRLMERERRTGCILGSDILWTQD